MQKIYIFFQGKNKEVHTAKLKSRITIKFL